MAARGRVLSGPSLPAAAAVRPGWTLLGSSDGRSSLGKLLVEYLSAPRPGLDVYREYLSTSVGRRVSHRFVSLLDEPLLRRFYEDADDDADDGADDGGGRPPAADPRYLDPTSNACLSQLEECAGRRLVLLHPGQTTAFPYFKLHDKRLFDHLRGAPPRETRFAVLVRRLGAHRRLPGEAPAAWRNKPRGVSRTPWELYAFDAAVALLAYSPFGCERGLAVEGGRRRVRPGPCWLASLARVLGLRGGRVHACRRPLPD